MDTHRLKPYKRPDDDPLEVLPRERFERATMRPGALKTYGQLLYEPMAPNQPPYPVVLWNEMTQVPEPARPRMLKEIIYRISWTYRLPSHVVEWDLGRAMTHHLQQNLNRALQEGRLRALG